MELILIGFGDVVTALCPAMPKVAFFDEDLNKKHNAKMLPAWSWPGLFKSAYHINKWKFNIICKYEYAIYTYIYIYNRSPT